MKKINYCFLALLCPLLSLAQVKPLQVGDTLPAIKFTNLVNHCEPALDINTRPGKLVILDFWASWCASCKRGLEKLDSIAQYYPGEVEVLLVNSKQTGDAAPRVHLHYRNEVNKLFTKYPSIVEDTILTAFFPHSAVPHYIWIYNGVVKAIASWRDLTRENVDAVLAGKSFKPKKR